MQVKSVCLAVALAGAALSVQAGPVLDAVRARGQVICGVNTAAFVVSATLYGPAVR